ncbi:TonB-dependent receptor [Desulfonema ishimotonii]|uniref:TonB-dependent receptor n=1 Tax=Desulfonema ishimotonii TaxID=45657 RepID=A0A401FWX9_9BACT|nr:TonB-dependent receptor [Desulfonema ishimotonii]GBC61461.1 TonB-dependent receptor [Desulfonema ishimotonii]
MRMRLSYCVVQILLVAVMGVTAFSEEVPPDDKRVGRLDEVVVTARGTDSRISQTPGGVGVIDADVVSEQQPMSLTNATRRIPGVEKSSDSAWGSAINIRGLGRNSVIFLIDGCRVNTATDINAQFGLVNPSDIERIEVLKGPVSALYGSGSIGGVVNVITKKGRFTETPQWHGETALSYTDNPEGVGTYGNLSFNSPDRWAFASGSYRDHDSYEAGDGDAVANSQFRDSHAKAGAGVKWNALNVTELQGQYSEARGVGIPGKGLSLPSGPDVTYTRTSLALLSLTHTFTPEGLSLAESKLSLFYQKIQRQVRIDHFPAAFPLTENRPGADHETWGLKWQNRFDLGTHTLVAGTDIWNWEIGDSGRYKTLKNGLTGEDSSLGDVEQFSGGIFAEDDWQLSERFVLNIGGRADYIEAESNDLYNWTDPPTPSIPISLRREGDTYDDVSWNAHAGLTWNLLPRWSMTFISASSYRAPDLMDRFKYISLGGGIELFGNPDLDPERSLFFEYGLHYNTRNLRFTASAYANYLDDLITEKVISDTVHRMENVDEAEIYGAEFDVEWFFLPGWAAYANVAVTDGEDTTTDEDLPFIPPLNGLVGVRYDHSAGFWGSLELEWAAKQDDVPSGRMESGSWETMNVRAGYRFPMGKTRQEIMVGVDNLFDKEYRNYLSTSRDIELKEPGISFLAAWKMRF